MDSQLFYLDTMTDSDEELAQVARSEDEEEEEEEEEEAAAQEVARVGEEQARADHEEAILVANMNAAAQAAAGNLEFKRVTIYGSHYIRLRWPVNWIVSGNLVDATTMFTEVDFFMTAAQPEFQLFCSLTKMKQKKVRETLYTKPFLKPCDQRGDQLPIEYKQLENGDYVLDDDGNKIVVLWTPEQKLPKEKDFEAILKVMRDCNEFAVYRTTYFLKRGRHTRSTRILRGTGQVVPHDNFLYAGTAQHLTLLHWQLSKERSPLLYLVHSFGNIPRPMEPRTMVEQLEAQHNNNDAMASEMRLMNVAAQAHVANVVRRSRERALAQQETMIVSVSALFSSFIAYCANFSLSPCACTPGSQL